MDDSHHGYDQAFMEFVLAFCLMLLKGWKEIMFTQQNAHVHDFKKLNFIREVGVAGEKTINRMILVRECTCGSSQAFECGDKNTMQELYKDLLATSSVAPQDVSFRKAVF